MAYRLVMTGDIRVIEDGADQRLSARPPTPPWVWILVGLAAGIGFAVVFVTPSSTVSAPETVENTVVEIDPVLSPGQTNGITDAVPGFPDALVAVAQTGRQNLEHLLWPFAGDPVTRALPVGAFGDSKFDVTGTWLAVSTRIPETGETFLSRGKPSSLIPLASGVTSFTWHDSESGRLAYTQITDDVLEVRVSRSGRSSELVTTDSALTAEVAAWGDWGWAIQDESGRITLLNEAAVVKTTSQGNVLDSHPDGWILTYDFRVRLLSAGGGLRALDVDPATIGEVLGGAISPDRGQVALVGTMGLTVVTIADDSVAVSVPFTVPNTKVSWSSDSRFVLVPSLRGVIIVDTGTGELFEEITEHVIVEAAVIPLSR